MWTKINAGNLIKDYKSFSNKGLTAKVISINEHKQNVKVQVIDTGKSKHFKEEDIVTLNYYTIDEYFKLIDNTIKKL